MLVDVNTAFEIMKKPFAPEDIEWRVGSKTRDKTKGTALAYMDARAVAERFDEAVGPENWEVKYQPIDMGVSSKLDKQGNATDYKGFVATITIKLKDEDGNEVVVSRSDGSNLTDFESIKGGLSGALKRAASQFGIGRYLYGLKAEWYPLDQYGNLATTPRLPEWALPDGYEYPPEAPKATHIKSTSDDNPFASNYEPMFVPGDDAPAGEAVIPQGKHKGTKVSDMTDVGYLQWVLNRADGPAWAPIKGAVQSRLAELS